MSRSRSRLPKGYSKFRADLGEVLRSRRRDERQKQQTVADAVGVTRETLSRIERGRAWPLPDTLDALMRVLGLDWSQVAEQGESGRDVRRLFNGTWRDDLRLELCRAVRTERRRRGLTLAQAAVQAGLSTAQLSRIERGQFGRSQVLEDLPDDARRPYDERRVRFKNLYLRELASADPG